MKKWFILILALVVLITSVFVSCKQKTDDEVPITTAENLQEDDSVLGFETDENGEQVAVVYEKDKNGKTIAIKLDKDGNKLKDKNGEYVTVKTDYNMSDSKNNSNNNKNEDNTNKLTTVPTQAPTGTTAKDIPMTSSAETTKFEGSETVPKLSDSGKKVNFSVTDQNKISSMLEVPYLYLSNYENSDGVPINIACHVAVWMAQNEGGTMVTYPSSPVVLNLFKYFGQTVVNFKTQCNEFSGNAPITYNKSADTFSITEYTSKKQSVEIVSIEDLGDNNFYKVTGKVSGCDKKTVVAIVQKNRLEPTLGFSIKALKWS